MKSKENCACPILDPRERIQRAEYCFGARHRIVISLQKYKAMKVQVTFTEGEGVLVVTMTNKVGKRRGSFES